MFWQHMNFFGLCYKLVILYTNKILIESDNHFCPDTTGLEKMEKNNNEVIQYISSTAFLPHQYYNHIECSTLYDVVNSRTVNTFKNRPRCEDNPPDVQVSW